MKRVLLLLCTLALLLCACQAEPPVDEPDDLLQDGQLSPLPAPVETPVSLPQALVLPLLSNITLDPVNCPDGVQQTVGALVYEGLFALDEHFAVQNVLCESYSYNASRRTYRFTLRDDATFSNGSKLRASDVLATYQRAAESARYGARFAAVSSMRVNNGELVITLTQDDASFPALLDIPIVRSGSESRTFPLGTGAYVPMQDEDGTLFLQLREGAQSALPERIELYEVKDNEAAAYRFATGEVNLLLTDLTGLSPADASGEVSRTDAPTSAMLYLGFNTRNPLLSGSTLRAAMSTALDRREAAARIYAGHASPAQFALSPADARYPTALERSASAAAYAEALAGAEGELTLLVNEENSFKLALSQWVCTQLSTSTLTVTLRALPWEEYLAALENGDFDLYLGEVTLRANWDIGAFLRERVVALLPGETGEEEAEDAVPVTLVTGGTLNYGGYENTTAIALLEAYLAAPDAEHMEALCRQLQLTAPFAPLLFKSTTLLTPTGFLENAAPTAADPFAHAEEWTLHFAQK